MLGLDRDFDAAAYGALCTWTAAGALFAVGLTPRETRGLDWKGILVLLAAFGGMGLAVEAISHVLPSLVTLSGSGLPSASKSALPGTTGWYVALSAAPLGLAIAAAAGAARGCRRGEVPGWLPLAMVLLAGAQLHNLFVPSVYGPVLATADLLRSASAAVVVAGGMVELARLSRERASLLGVERERARRLGELSTLKADFMAMVAHELGGPLAAVRRLADLLDRGGADDPELRSYAVSAIREQADALKALVSDVREAASAERDDFRVEPRPVKLRTILNDARAFADSLSGDHPVVGVLVSPEGTEEEEVLADPARVGQVLRNLVSNASKHSLEGVPIELRATSGDREGRRCRVLIEVADKGAGIHPDDLDHVFEKFGRGRNAEGGKVEGVGLGLYLSRRITMAHGSDLSVRSALGEGSIFSFELKLLNAGKGSRDRTRGTKVDSPAAR
ncbi:MAG: HAMP domain-containing histidine kinase [Actinomycetota bacterium]|nr:HAMP domain-containing histidine kinase [Actinomycetota bacterium]